MKSTGTIESNDGLWNAPNTGATNESGFSALPSGGRDGFTENTGDQVGLGYYYSLHSGG